MKEPKPINCDCDVNELLKKPIFPHIKNCGSYIPYGKGGLVFCDKHHGWVGFQWLHPQHTDISQP